MKTETRYTVEQEYTMKYNMFIIAKHYKYKEFFKNYNLRSVQFGYNWNERIVNNLISADTWIEQEYRVIYTYTILYISTFTIPCARTSIPCNFFHITFMSRSVGINWEEAASNHSCTHLWHGVQTTAWHMPLPFTMALCVHVASICIFSNLASLAIVADFAKRYLPRAHGGNWENTHMPLGPPIYSDWEAASQVFSLWRVEWFQVFQLPCPWESETARAGVRRSGSLCLLPSRVVWICLVWSAECRGQSLHQIARRPPVTCHMPHATSYNMSLNIYI